MEAWEIARAATVMFPTAKLQGEGRFKVVFRLDSDRVLKVSKTALGQEMERKAYEKEGFPRHLVPWTKFISTRVQIQERLEPCGQVPKRELKRLKREFKKVGVCDVRPANIGSKDGNYFVIDWLPNDWKKQVRKK